jgi:putative nucleotidyltransferase-like protein/peptidase S24-like protein
VIHWLPTRRSERSAFRQTPASAAAVLEIALNARIPTADAPWSRILDLAIRERCAALCWLRCGGQLRAVCPPDVVDRWRGEVCRGMELAAHWSALLREAQRSLNAARVSWVVLKGLPLAQRLYGAAYARPSSDLDIFVPSEHRAQAREALDSVGWNAAGGDDDREAVFRKTRGGRSFSLEVHSALADDNLLRHLRLPAPHWSAISVEGTPIPSFTGSLLPGYLALHLAKHQMPPLLWLLDFTMLWRSLTAAERESATSTARMHALHRYLAWAIRRSTFVEAAARGESRALQALGFIGDQRTDVHNAIRAAALAAGPRHAASVVAAWLVPHQDRSVSPRMIGNIVHRLSRPLWYRLWPTRSYGARDPGDGSGGLGKPSDHRGVALGSADSLSLVKEVVDRGACFWVRVNGSSMGRSIPNAASVRLTAARALSRGDVVLARVSGDRVALHRIVGFLGGRLRLAGDNNVRDDGLVDRHAVFARVDRVRIADGEYDIATRGGPSWRQRLRRTIHALRGARTGRCG